MSNITVIAKILAKEGSVEDVKGELLKLITPTREEKGCIEYILHQDSEDPALFIFYETWDSLDSLEKHMKSAHFIQYVTAVSSMIGDKVVHKMTKIA
ncbi:MAG: putative quinol monooxygenase [Desulfuromonadaceae bacterium]|nr:putative quinol monooxygenase [Desulfuromonadaceae bacterium]